MQRLDSNTMQRDTLTPQKPSIQPLWDNNNFFFCLKGLKTAQKRHIPDIFAQSGGAQLGTVGTDLMKTAGFVLTESTNAPEKRASRHDKPWKQAGLL